MALRQQISDALKEAVKAKDRTTTSTLRLISAALKDRDIAARTTGAGNAGINEDEIAMIAKTFREVEGPFYVHCYHGKHRGPAAAAIGRVALDGLGR